VCVLYLEKNNTFGDTERGVEKSTHTRVSKNESTREVKRAEVQRAEVQRATQMQAEEQITSENFSFFSLPRLSKQGTNFFRGESQSCISEREDDIRERARARFISHFIYLSRRERQRIKSDDDDDDDDDASSSSRPRSRSLFLLVGEY
jgi:hypothetical protein